MPRKSRVAGQRMAQTAFQRESHFLVTVMKISFLSQSWLQEDVAVGCRCSECRCPAEVAFGPSHSGLSLVRRGARLPARVGWAPKRYSRARRRTAYKDTEALHTSGSAAEGTWLWLVLFSLVHVVTVLLK